MTFLGTLLNGTKKIWTYFVKLKPWTKQLMLWRVCCFFSQAKANFMSSLLKTYPLTGLLLSHHLFPVDLIEYCTLLTALVFWSFNTGNLRIWLVCFRQHQALYRPRRNIKNSIDNDVLLVNKSRDKPLHLNDFVLRFFLKLLSRFSMLSFWNTLK